MSKAAGRDDEPEQNPSVSVFRYMSETRLIL